MIPRWKLNSRLEQGHDWLSILRKGSFPNKCSTPRGDPANPFSAEELTSKFYRLAGMLAGCEKAEAVVKAVRELRNTGMEGLFGALKELKGE